jgi:hypothetical protein
MRGVISNAAILRKRERHCSAGTLIKFAATLDVLIYGYIENDFEIYIKYL